jgi:hypothetical protein
VLEFLRQIVWRRRSLVGGMQLLRRFVDLLLDIAV